MKAVFTRRGSQLICIAIGGRGGVEMFVNADIHLQPPSKGGYDLGPLRRGLGAVISREQYSFQHNVAIMVVVLFQGREDSVRHSFSIRAVAEFWRIQLCDLRRRR